jgi:O-antigen/teichoic acid export membrane protein
MRAALGRNVLANLINVAASIGASLVSLPFILDRIGTAGYGVWTIALTFIVYLTGAEGGFGPAAQRWASVSHGGGEREGVHRVLWTSLLLYTLLGIVVAVVIAAAAEGIVDLFSFPRRFHDDAVEMFRVVAVVMALTLVAAALGNVLQGIQRFAANALTSAAGSAAYLAGILIFLHGDNPLTVLALAAASQQVVTVLGRAVALRHLILAGRPTFLPRHEIRGLVGFSVRLQVGVLSGLFNSQSDKIVVGLVAPTRTLGQLGIATQFADAGRLVAGAALIPINTSLAVAVGARDHDRLVSEFAWVNRIWQITLVGATLIGLGALYPLIAGWLGPGHVQAAVLAAFLVAGTGFSLLGGTSAGYLRAIGRPGLEGRYGVIVVALNIAFTVPLAIAAGAIGVVAGTLAAYVTGVWWFMRRFWAVAPDLPRVPAREFARAMALGVACGAVVGAIGVAAIEALPQGVSLVPTVAAFALGLACYLALATRTPLRLQSFKELALSLMPERAAGSAPAGEGGRTPAGDQVAAGTGDVAPGSGLRRP